MDMDGNSVEVMDTTTMSASSSLAGTIEGPVKTLEPKLKLKNFSLSDSFLIPLISEKTLQQVFSASVLKAASSVVQKNKEKTPLTPEQGQELADEEFEIVSMDDDDEEKSKPVRLGTKPSPVPPQPSPFVTAAIALSQQTVTENLAPTFSTSDDARLDFYFGVMEQTSYPGTVELLKSSWAANDLDTLKLLANLRDIRGGKGIRPQYQQCLYWLYENHPKTLYENLSELVQFGYWKDVLHLLVIILFDGYIHPYFKQDADPKKISKSKKPTKFKLKRELKRNLQEEKLKKRPLSTKVNLKRKQSIPPMSYSEISSAKEERIAADAEKRIYNQLILDYYKIKQEISKLSKNEMTALRLQYAREKFETDLKYKIFHIKIAQLFASQLIKDLSELNKVKEKGTRKEISLAGKWAPSLKAHFDKFLLIGSTIALEISKQTGKMEDISSKSNSVATYLARKAYHKEYCVPLRRFHKIPEHYMSTNKWNELDYTRVAAKCMKKNKLHFIKHDKERFEAYLVRPDTKVAGATLKPVELICEAMSLEMKTEAERIILEKQWSSLAESIKKNGGGMLKNAVSICDVSGSMHGTPMNAAIGLTLLTMEMTEAPWNSICITFSAYPELFNLDANLTLLQKIEALKAMRWGMNTDLNKVFELIVSLGEKNKLTSEEMPKLLFVFTDMEFDEAYCDSTINSGGDRLTNFNAAKLLFEKNGYQMPTIVFWNLRDTQRKGSGGRLTATSTPVQKNELGVILLSGFAGQTLSQIMNQPDFSNCTPLKFMLDVLNTETYSKLAIYD